MFRWTIQRFACASKHYRVITGISQRCAFSTTFRGMAKVDDFNDRLAKLKTLTDDPGNMVKLEMYALYKQATEGNNSSPKPGMMNFVAKAKWDAWNGLKDMSKEDAMDKYIKIVDSLVEKEGKTGDTNLGISSSSKESDEVLVEKKGNAYIMTLNRPHKYNAITLEMYAALGDCLHEAAKDDSVSFVVVQGEGKYYCAGNDLKNFERMAAKMGGDMKKSAELGGTILDKFVRSFIDFPKPLIAFINGPAVGISVTILGMFDVVYASDISTFHTPFASLGQSPEGCSSFLFPRIMGYAAASEMLFFEKKLTAQEAKDRGLVTEVFAESQFVEKTNALLEKYSQLPKGSLFYGKQLIRAPLIETLHKVNRAECERLVERWQSEECLAAILKFMNRQVKS